MIALTAILMIGVLAPMALAEDTANVTTDTTTVLTSATDSTIANEADATFSTGEDVSTGKMAWKQVGLWFTFNQEKKAEKELDLARLQLIKAKIAARDNNTAAMEKALDAHDKLINSVEKRTENLRKLDKNSEKLKGLDRAIEVHNARINKLNDLLANTNLTSEQRDKIENRLAHIENVTAKLTGVQSKIYAKIDAKISALKTEANAKNITVEELVREKAKERINSTED